jgi:hypothetical protein
MAMVYPVVAVSINVNEYKNIELDALIQLIYTTLPAG